MEMPMPKRSSPSLDPILSQSDIVAELHRSEVEIGSSTSKSRKRPGKKVTTQGEPSHHETARTPASSSRVECKEIGESEDALQHELETKKLEVAMFFNGFTTAVPLPDKRA
ncbi:hypothetical protein FNV43_RR22633 [Rhamnella rubrinervis]|uniref:Uncharacterized protein n=1 Tax=Rhamnella rubrinervis TaxID=2594499 RepID=A0A8K0DWZ5_9ROSA|nr:hypothetical protein FNV43_RR22633 [Rhamnella rubrinervis]